MSLPWFAAVADHLESHPKEAEGVLRAAALAVTGDEMGARRRLQHVLSALSPDTEAKAVLDAALLLRGMLRERARDLEDARRDYRTLAERRPDDPLPRVRLAALALASPSTRARSGMRRGSGHALRVTWAP